MAFKRYDKRYLPMLWIGLAIWVIGIGGSALLDALGIEVSSQESLMSYAKYLFQRAPILILLLLCVIQPIFEEFGFRLWGVGKKWMTIVCLVIMAIFTISEIKLWGILFFVAFILVLWLVHDDFKRKWIATLLSSLMFALCHISGFGGFSLGMVLGLLDIFGMAMVMCWLTLNLSFWFSCLLHVCNNSLALLIPLLFVSPYSESSAVRFRDDAGKEYSLRYMIEYVHPFNAPYQLSSLEYVGYTLGKTAFVDEPQKIAALLMNNDSTLQESEWTVYRGQPKDEMVEERIVWGILDTVPYPQYHDLVTLFLESYENFTNKTFTYDTSMVELYNIWLVYADGRKVELDSVESEDYQDAFYRVNDNNLGAQSRWTVKKTDATGTHTYCYKVENSLADQLAPYEQLNDKIFGYRLEYRPSGKKIRLITIK